MKKIDRILGLGFLVTLLAVSCTKVDLPRPQIIDLGNQSTSTAIKSIAQTGNIVTAEFETTVGAKYSVQNNNLNCDIKRSSILLTIFSTFL